MNQSGRRLKSHLTDRVGHSGAFFGPNRDQKNGRKISKNKRYGQNKICHYGSESYSEDGPIGRVIRRSYKLEIAFQITFGHRRQKSVRNGVREIAR